MITLHLKFNTSNTRPYSSAANCITKAKILKTKTNKPYVDSAMKPCVPKNFKRDRRYACLIEKKILKQDWDRQHIHGLETHIMVVRVFHMVPWGCVICGKNIWRRSWKNFGWNLGGETHMGWKAFLGGILTYNHVHNILRLFDSWANFSFTISVTKRDY